MSDALGNDAPEAPGASGASAASAIGHRIAALLRRSAGLEVELLGTWGVQHAVAERIDALTAAGEPMNAARYLDRVEHDVAEQQWLIEAVVIPETWFFRHHQSFDFIVSAALARLSTPVRGLGGHSTPTTGLHAGNVADALPRVLRIASVPCSTGEEPYSIAMALLDAGISPERFVIDAIDISHHALSQARKGFYRRNAFRSNRPGFQAQYFDYVEEGGMDGWQIKPFVRRCVTFRPGNLVTDLVFAQAQHYDFVLCRNVLIYFDRPTQNAVVTRLRHALRDDGHLLVGPAEAALVSRFGLDPTPAPLAFAFHRPTAATGKAFDAGIGATFASRSSASPLLANLAAMTSTANHPTSSQQRDPHGMTRAGGMSSLAAKGSDFPSVIAKASSAPSGPTVPRARPTFGQRSGLPPASLSGEPENPSKAAEEAASASVVALAKAKQLADAGQLEQAESVCQGLLKKHPSADIYCLLGLIADARGQLHQAREHFRRAVYLDAAHADALLQLATHLSRDGDEAGAERLLSRARRARPDLF